MKHKSHAASELILTYYLIVTAFLQVHGLSNPNYPVDTTGEISKISVIVSISAV